MDILFQIIEEGNENTLNFALNLLKRILNPLEEQQICELVSRYSIVEKLIANFKLSMMNESIVSML